MYKRRNLTDGGATGGNLYGVINFLFFLAYYFLCFTSFALRTIWRTSPSGPTNSEV